MDASTNIEAAPSPAAPTPVPPQPATHTRPDSPPHICRLPHHPESAGAARRITNTLLHEWDVDDETTHQALLVVSELVTNALEHALPPIVLHLQHPKDDGTLRIEVDDGGPANNKGTWTTSCAPEEHGRGVGIIAFLASAHGTRILAHTVTYWAILPAAS
ncbi:ATP-binding protein [Streptomyces sp. NPDC001549]|uniref:ATP-binding protein n=1 Tax=Streptomyces sp. NPDC001549 TaxID=3364586 RepID=UPI0036CAC516